MNWRAGLLVLAVTVLSPVLAGCGGDDTPFPFPTVPGQTFPPESRANVLSLGSSLIAQGTPSAIEVRLVNPANVAGVQGRLLYNSDLFEVVNPSTLGEGVSAFEGSVLSGGGTINYEENRAAVNGQKGITFAIGNATGVNSSGRLFRLWFRPRAGAAANAATTLTLDPAFPFLMAGPRGEVLVSNVSEGALIVAQ